MSLGSYMHSPVGFGVYGNLGAGLLDTVLSVGGGALKTVVGQVAGPIEISTPSELAGAKLTSGFKIIKDGTSYKIVLDTTIPGLSTFTGKVISGKEAVKEDLAGVITLEYIPPPTNYVPFIIGGALAVAALAFFMMRDKAAPAARKRRKKSRKRRRRRR